MAYEMIHKHAEWLRSELHDFARRIVNAEDQERDLADLLETYMSSRLDYDLVYQDEAQNMVGILVGADTGSTVLLRSSFTGEECGHSSNQHHSRVAGPVSQIYAGHVLSRNDMFQQGTIVTACSLAPPEFFERGTRYLIESTLPKLNIDPRITIQTGNPLDPPSSEDDKSDLENILSDFKSREMRKQVEPGNILTADYGIPVVRCGADQSCAEEDTLVEMTYITAALLYRFLLTARPF